MDFTILAGPIVRRADADRLVFWLASRESLRFRLCLEGREPLLFDEGQQEIRVGESCYIQLLDLPLNEPLPLDMLVHYDLQWQRSAEHNWHGTAEWGGELCFNDESLPSLVIRSRLDAMLHGSCRKPHHAAPDGLVAAERWLSERQQQPMQRPALLMMSGDQIYADDVAGPMLTAIHQLIKELGLYDEQLEGATVANSQELFADPLSYYRRHQLLPDTHANLPLQKRFFEGARKPIFTTSSAANHLITLSEVLAMYLLVWSPVPWRLLPDTRPALDEAFVERYERERGRLLGFVEGLPAVRRLLAHVPTLMIFDDHDVTDDWNLTAGWEQTAYGHPFSKRIIGNALAGYLICQGWGNDPDAFAGDPLTRLHAWSQQPDCERQDQLINCLLKFDGWQYHLDTQPRLLVLDTRTRRWRSESNLNRPSGLMDWEALTELQGEMLNRESVVVISPTPVFGVKLIEAIQKVFTWLGKPLLVDAENWMAHKGTANVIVNIFRHARTPANYVILSGDVHYSFMYDIRVRQRGGEPHIWQITSSGIKNEFPRRLLDVLDRLNRWLYAPRSPLNWFTRRRKLRISPHSPVGASKGERLLNRAGIGYVRFNEQGEPVCVQQITAEGVVDFIEPDMKTSPVELQQQGRQAE